MNIVELRIWTIRELIAGIVVYVTALAFAIFPTGHLRMFGIVALIGLAVLTLAHDPRGAATWRGVIRWNEWAISFSNGNSPDLFWLAFWRLAFWATFPLSQIIVFALALVQRDRQRAAWRNATAAWIAAFEDEAARFQNPALDPANDDAPDGTPHKKHV